MRTTTRHLAILCLSLGALSIALPAQLKKYAVTPAGAEFHPGNSNNTYPFYGASAHYQQIHDAVDMRSLNAGGTMIMSAIGFRPAASYNISARSWDVQIHLSPTSVPASQMSTTFSANVTSSPTTVIPFTKINAPSGAGQGTTVPNALVWSFPFTTLFIYSPSQGNLLWEWQSKNSTVVSTPMDAVSGTNSAAPRAGQNMGTGCTATGRTSPAQAQATVGSNATMSLVNGPSNASALLWIGVQRTNITGLGWCSSLYVNPLLALAGSTDASGNWNAVSVPASSLSTAAYWEAFCQFGFADSGLGGFGLSDLAAFAGPPNVGKHVSRMWVVSSAQGNETAATGTRGLNYGVITMFEIK